MKFRHILACCLIYVLLFATLDARSSVDPNTSATIERSKEVMRDDPVRALALMDSLLQKESLTDEELTEIHYQRGKVYYLELLERGDAILSFYQALRHSRQTDNVQRQNDILTYLGLSYKALNHFEYAQGYYAEALLLDLPSEKSRLLTLYNLGKTLRLAEQYDSAIAIQNRLIPSFQQMGDMEGFIISCQLELGSNYYGKKDWTAAARTYHHLHDVAEQADDQRLKAKALISLGAIYMNGESLDSARSYLTESLPLMLSAGDEALLLDNYNNLGVLAEAEGDVKKAREFWMKSAELDPRRVDVSVQIANIQDVIRISQELQDHEAALIYSQRLNEIMLPLVELQETFEELHARYLAEKIRTEIEAFELRESLTIAQLRISLIATVLALITVIGALVYWILKKRQRLDDSVIEHLKQRDQLLYYISYRYNLDVPSMMREMHSEDKLM